MTALCILFTAVWWWLVWRRNMWLRYKTKQLVLSIKLCQSEGPLCLVPICNHETAFCRRIRAVWLRREEEHGKVWPGDTSTVQPESGDVTCRPVLRWQRQTVTRTSKTVLLTFRGLSFRSCKVNYLKQDFKCCTPWRNSLHRLHQGVLYFQNVIRFRRTQANVIACSP
jgi:hypothetical protein